MKAVTVDKVTDEMLLGKDACLYRISASIVSTYPRCQGPHRHLVPLVCAMVVSAIWL